MIKPLRFRIGRGWLSVLGVTEINVLASWLVAMVEGLETWAKAGGSDTIKREEIIGRKCVLYCLSSEDYILLIYSIQGRIRIEGQYPRKNINVLLIFTKENKRSDS